MASIKRCTACVLPANYPGISFDERGMCNICLDSHDDSGKTRPRDPAELLELIARQRKGDAQYDCIVAISGGRDSTFMAHYAVRILGLNALAYTYDNGFMPQQTRENVQNSVHSLGIDHVMDRQAGIETYARHMLSSWMHKPSPAMIPLLCTGCMTGLNGGLLRAAHRYRVGLVLTGSGEPEESFAIKLLLAPAKLGATSPGYGRRRKYALLLGLLKEVIRNPRYSTHLGSAVAAVKEFYWRYVSKRFDRAGVKRLSLFNFVEWNEDTILSTIARDLGWAAPSDSPTSWRSDCQVHLLRQYLYLGTLGWTKNDVILSSQIRSHTITRAQALERLEHENLIPHEFLTTLMDRLGTSLADLDMVLSNAQANRSLSVG